MVAGMEAGRVEAGDVEIREGVGTSKEPEKRRIHEGDPG